MDQDFLHAADLYESGHPDQALEIYKKILKINPDHHGALHCSGIIAHSKGKGKQAVGAAISPLAGISPGRHGDRRQGRQYRAGQ